MEILDTAEGRAAPSQETHSSVDRFETVRIFEEREEVLRSDGEAHSSGVVRGRREAGVQRR